MSRELFPSSRSDSSFVLSFSKPKNARQSQSGLAHFVGLAFFRIRETSSASFAFLILFSVCLIFLVLSARNTCSPKQHFRGFTHTCSGSQHKQGSADQASASYLTSFKAKKNLAMSPISQKWANLMLLRRNQPRMRRLVGLESEGGSAILHFGLLSRLGSASFQAALHSLRLHFGVAFHFTEQSLREPSTRSRQRSHVFSF